jgi:hypothetical protein
VTRRRCRVSQKFCWYFGPGILSASACVVTRATGDAYPANYEWITRRDGASNPISSAPTNPETEPMTCNSFACPARGGRALAWCPRTTKKNPHGAAPTPVSAAGMVRAESPRANLEFCLWHRVDRSKYLNFAIRRHSSARLAGLVTKCRAWGAAMHAGGHPCQLSLSSTMTAISLPPSP